MPKIYFCCINVKENKIFRKHKKSFLSFCNRVFLELWYNFWTVEHLEKLKKNSIPRWSSNTTDGYIQKTVAGFAYSWASPKCTNVETLNWQERCYPTYCCDYVLLITIKLWVWYIIWLFSFCSLSFPCISLYTFIFSFLNYIEDDLLLAII